MNFLNFSFQFRNISLAGVVVPSHEAEATHFFATFFSSAAAGVAAGAAAGAAASGAGAAVAASPSPRTGGNDKRIYRLNEEK